MTKKIDKSVSFAENMKGKLAEIAFCRVL